MHDCPAHRQGPAIDQWQYIREESLEAEEERDIGEEGCYRHQANGHKTGDYHDSYAGPLTLSRDYVRLGGHRFAAHTSCRFRLLLGNVTSPPQAEEGNKHCAEEKPYVSRIVPGVCDYEHAQRNGRNHEPQRSAPSCSPKPRERTLNVCPKWALGRLDFNRAVAENAPQRS